MGVNIGSCNGSLPDCTKGLLEPILTSHVRFWGIYLRAILQQVSKHPVLHNEYENYKFEITATSSRIRGNGLWILPIRYGVQGLR